MEDGREGFTLIYAAMMDFEHMGVAVLLRARQPPDRPRRHDNAGDDFRWGAQRVITPV
jgi:hypothetical protein